MYESVSQCNVAERTTGCESSTNCSTKIQKELKGDVGNSLLPYQQILVEAILSALIGPKWCMKGQLMHSTKMLNFGPMQCNESRENGFNKNL
jgi:hypothetical protein